MTTYYVLRIGAIVTRVVPLAVLYALAGAAAWLAALVPSAARSAARANIGRVMGLPPGGRRVRRAAAQALRYQALNYVDLMRLGHISRADFDATVAYGDVSVLSRCLALGKGAIVVSAHLGNVDYTSQWLSLHGFEVHVPMERLEPERLYRYVVGQRAATGLHFYPIGPEAMGPMSRALRAGGVAAALCDRDIGGTGQPVRFFGATARLPAGAVLLALRTGAPLVPAFGRRLRDNRLYIAVDPPVFLTRTGDLRADLQAGLGVLAGVLERAIARTPEQWVVFEHLWPEAPAIADTPAPARRAVFPDSDGATRPCVSH